MKKVLVGILLLLVIAGVGAPFVSGLMMEKIVKKSFSNFNSMYSEAGYDVSVEIVRYDRHFSSSEIEWKLKLGSLKAIYGVDEIIFLDRADHQYTGIVTRTSLEKNKWFTDFVNSKLAGKNPLTITTEYKLSGEIHSTIDLAAFSLPVEGEVVEIKAGKSDFSCDKDLKNFSSEASWEGFSVAEKLKVDSIFMNSEMEKVSTYLWDGTLSYGFKKGTFAEGVEHFELTNFKGDYSVDVDKDESTVSVVATFGADSLLANLEKVDDFFVRFGVVNLDAQGLEDFVKLYTEMTNSVLKDIAAAEGDPEMMKTILKRQVAQSQLQMLTAYERLMKKGLEFQISDLHAQFPQGEVKGDLVVSLRKDMTFAQFVPLQQQPELILDILSLQSEMSFPAGLVGDNPMLLSPIYSGMKTGLFVRDGDNLIHKAETRDGKLYLNGQELMF
jgi:uncharacterized protein YdgA (DUF945 family)